MAVALERVVAVRVAVAKVVVVAVAVELCVAIVVAVDMAVKVVRSDHLILFWNIIPTGGVSSQMLKCFSFSQARTPICAASTSVEINTSLKRFWM